MITATITRGEHIQSRITSKMSVCIMPFLRGPDPCAKMLRVFACVSGGVLACPRKTGLGRPFAGLAE
jgi:hypothetical protein